MKRSTRSECSANRQALGHIRDLVVGRRGLKAYGQALALFMCWLRQLEVSWPSDPEDLDPVVCDYICTAWEEGESRSQIGHLLSGLANLERQSSRYLAGS